jgi:nucleolar protein 53
MQAPNIPNLHAAIALPAVPAPHAGTSYNPPEAAHTELLRAAHEAELRRAQEAEALEATKARILSTRHADGGNGDDGAPGMLIDKPGDRVEEQEDIIHADQSQDGLDATASATKPAPQRKTKQQRRKADKLRAEVCGLNLSLPPSFSSSVKNTILETCPLGAHPTETVACVCRHCQDPTQYC